MRSPKNQTTILQAVILVLSLVAAVAISASVGSANLTVWDSLKLIFNPSGMDGVYQTIIWKVRLPRVLMSGLTGAGLAMAGAAFQGLFQNPLAEPHVLGVSSGAALGATIAMVFGAASSKFMGMGLIGLCAFAGAFAATLLVYGIARTGSRVSAVHIVLAGSAVSAMLSAVISLIMSFHHDSVDRVYFWMLGSFSGAHWFKVAFLCGFVILSGFGLLLFSRDLDTLSTGEETAASLGVDMARTKKLLILLTSLMVAACVSVSGVIGFVGLIVPHILRILTGPSHRKLLPFSAIGGAIFMILCDTCARTAAAPSEIPVGAVTALIGGPYFIFLLCRNKKKTDLRYAKH